MIEEQEASAPYSTDDGKAVSIVTDREHPDSYLLFTNKTMDRFANILAEALDFSKEDGFYLNWKDGKFVYGWKWSDERLGTDEISAPEGLTFGEIVEKIMSTFGEVLFLEETPDSDKGPWEEIRPSWKNSPSGFPMKRVSGYIIYRNLLKACIPLYEKEAGLKWIHDEKDSDEKIFDVLNRCVHAEHLDQIGNRVSIFGEVIYPSIRGENICNNPLVLAGLCLLWHPLFFDFNDLGGMTKQELRDKNLLERCGGKSCEFVQDEIIWASKTKVAEEIAEGGFHRGLITKNCCYCGKIQIEALRAPSDPEIMDEIADLKTWDEMTEKELEDLANDSSGPWVTVSTTDDIMPHPTKKDSDGKKLFHPPIIGPGNEFDYGRFEGEENGFSNYRHDVLTGLLFSIFNGKRNYTVDESDPEYGKRDLEIKRVLPLPEADIRLLADIEIRSMEEDEYYERFTDEMPEQKFEAGASGRRRAAKHRLGRKITEIGQFLQWWDDLSADELFCKTEEYEIDEDEFGLRRVKEKPFRVLIDGVNNVRGKM